MDTTQSENLLRQLWSGTGKGTKLGLVWELISVDPGKIAKHSKEETFKN
jgi:ABC-type proline/glycine betaine transport system ATPase subunit